MCRLDKAYLHRQACLWRPVQGNRRCIQRTGQAQDGFWYNSAFVSLCCYLFYRLAGKYNLGVKELAQALHV
jgi:hypothetical protein